MANPNLQLLIDAARLLEPLLKELVFAGGSKTALFITDRAAADVRPTYDVDAIAAITSYAAYVDFSARLKSLGFAEDTSEGAPTCRWRQKTTTLDVMPLDEKVLGFSNRWYKPAMEAAEERELETGLRIRVVSAVYFCAAKLEAFARRGKNDYQSSHDLEDLIAMIDGRRELVQEIAAATAEVRGYLASQTKTLLSIPAFRDALPGQLLSDAGSQARLGAVISRLKAITEL